MHVDVGCRGICECAVDPFTVAVNIGRIHVRSTDTGPTWGRMVAVNRQRVVSTVSTMLHREKTRPFEPGEIFSNGDPGTFTVEHDAVQGSVGLLTACPPLENSQRSTKCRKETEQKMNRQSASIIIVSCYMVSVVGVNVMPSWPVRVTRGKKQKDESFESNACMRVCDY